MKRCPNCNSKNRNGAVRCKRCGRTFPDPVDAAGVSDASALTGAPTPPSPTAPPPALLDPVVILISVVVGVVVGAAALAWFIMYPSPPRPQPVSEMLRVEKKLLEGQLSEHRHEVSRLRALVAEKTEQLRRAGPSASGDLAAEKRRAAALEVRLAAVQATLDQEVRGGQLLAKQLAEAKRGNDSLRKQQREYARSVSDLVSRERQRVAQQITERDKRLAEARRENDLLRAQLRDRPVPAPAKPIQGKVTKVVNAGAAAQLNVGSADGVTIGMRFFLYRGGDVVAYLGVNEVADHACTGELTNFRTPAPGDRASTSLELN